METIPATHPTPTNKGQANCIKGTPPQPTTQASHGNGAKHNALAFQHPVEFSRNTRAPTTTAETVTTGAFSCMPATEPPPKAASFSLGPPQSSEPVSGLSPGGRRPAVQSQNKFSLKTRSRSCLKTGSSGFLRCSRLHGRCRGCKPDVLSRFRTAR